jgi:hypothetical protein
MAEKKKTGEAVKLPQVEPRAHRRHRGTNMKDNEDMQKDSFEDAKNRVGRVFSKNIMGDIFGSRSTAGFSDGFKYRTRMLAESDLNTEHESNIDDKNMDDLITNSQELNESESDSDNDVSFPSIFQLFHHYNNNYYNILL